MPTNNLLIGKDIKNAIQNKIKNNGKAIKNNILISNLFVDRGAIISNNKKKAIPFEQKVKKSWNSKW